MKEVRKQLSLTEHLRRQVEEKLVDKEMDSFLKISKSKYFRILVPLNKLLACLRSTCKLLLLL